MEATNLQQFVLWRPGEAMAASPRVERDADVAQLSHYSRRASSRVHHSLGVRALGGLIKNSLSRLRIARGGLISGNSARSQCSRDRISCFVATTGAALGSRSWASSSKQRTGMEGVSVSSHSLGRG